MSESEILDYYNENWNDYNKIVDMLHDMIDSREDEVNDLKNKLNKREKDNRSINRIKELEKLLQECQDQLDEERHKIK